MLDVLDGDEPPDPTQEIDLTPTWADDTDVTLDDIARIEGGSGDDNADPTAEVAATTGRRKRRRDRREAKETAKLAATTAATTVVTSPDRTPKAADPDDCG